MKPRGRVQSLMAVSWDGELRRSPDTVIVEEPLSIQLDDVLVNTTMRTPGHDFELAAGFVLAEGLLAGVPITTIRYCGTGSAVETEFNVVSVETGGRAPEPTPRLGTTSSSCGLCGSESIDHLCEVLDPLPDGRGLVPLEILAAIPDQVLANQKLFASTGAVHAAASFAADGTIDVVREDIGRHNAVDKVVGRLLLDGRVPAAGMGLFVSGRASFEMVQKAWAAGFSALVSASAPSGLAVETARRANLVLAGFAREGRVNVYSPTDLSDYPAERTQ